MRANAAAAQHAACDCLGTETWEGGAAATPQLLALCLDLGSAANACVSP